MTEPSGVQSGAHVIDTLQLVKLRDEQARGLQRAPPPPATRAGATDEALAIALSAVRKANAAAAKAERERKSAAALTITPATVLTAGGGTSGAAAVAATVAAAVKAEVANATDAAVANATAAAATKAAVVLSAGGFSSSSAVRNGSPSNGTRTGSAGSSVAGHSSKPATAPVPTPPAKRTAGGAGEHVLTLHDVADDNELDDDDTHDRLPSELRDPDADTRFATDARTGIDTSSSSASGRKLSAGGLAAGDADGGLVDTDSDCLDGCNWLRPVLVFAAVLAMVALFFYLELHNDPAPNAGTTPATARSGSATIADSEFP